MADSHVWEPPFTPEQTGGLRAYPSPEHWDDHVEFDAKAWPKKVERHYALVPTICFNCEAACGLLAYVDKETRQVAKFVGNPAHPASRGRNCAKGPATINQIKDPERILHPLRRKGGRGEGEWERVSWDEALGDIAARLRKALQEGRNQEIMYHVGRPGEDGFTERVLAAWGVDGHNSHTNICSSGARTGYAFWMGIDRPAPDFANARFILLLSSHLEAGHYFNPHAQRIIEAKMHGAKICVIDPRLSNTASHANWWWPAWPGSEAAILLAIANVLLQEERYDRRFLEDWVNWREYLRAEHPREPLSFERFLAILKETYARYTPEFAERESGIPAAQIREVAREVGLAGSRFSAHIWRSAAAGNLGGWMVARALFFLNVLTGSVGTEGGTMPNAWAKYVPHPPVEPPPVKGWNELTWPREYPLAHNEMSFLLPHFLKEGRGRLEVYFSRVYNPVWTNPDGLTWIEQFQDERKVGLHVCLTPTWSETAQFADYVLPMGLGPERHDLFSYETHGDQWIGFRQPVQRAYSERIGEETGLTYETNPGEVWEENEFWIELSWRIDPDGSMGIRRNFESPYRPGEKITIEEYYRWIFEHSVPGLPEAAAREGLTPMQYMRRYSAFVVREDAYAQHLEPVSATDLEGAQVEEETGRVYTSAPPAKRLDVKPLPAPPPTELGRPVGVMVGGEAVRGFPTPSGKLEFYSPTLKEWGWGIYAIPTYIPSHVRQQNLAQGQFVLISTFRLPTLVHTRSGNAKWLNEISHGNPVWMHPSDAKRLGLRRGDLVRVASKIGYFVNRIWITEGMKPGVVACSHHLGRWRLEGAKGNGWTSAVVSLEEQAPGKWLMRRKEGVKPFRSGDPDTERIWWQDSGVHQNLIFPVHPDPISGAHAWHQAVTVTKAEKGDALGDIQVDLEQAHAVYKDWLRLAKPAGPQGLRRPRWLLRPLRPVPQAYVLPQEEDEEAGEELDA